MKIAINAVSAKRGGAVTYLQNVLPALRDRVAAVDDGRLVVWRADASTGDEKWPDGIEYRADRAATGSEQQVSGSARRLFFDQIALPRTLARERFDTLFSSANFGPLYTSTRHVILLRNTLYFDPLFLDRIRDPRAKATLYAQRWLSLAAAGRADVVLFPSVAMMDLVAQASGGARPNWLVIPYGARTDLFTPREEGPRDRAHIELLNVSIYADQKNFGTLLCAVDRLHRRDAGRYKLRLTAGFHQDWFSKNSIFPNFARERDLFRRLAEAGVAEDVDWKRYGSLPGAYRNADVFVFPSYTESFGHPLVEAMASGLPIVAADVPINREMCGDAALYAAPFDELAFADAIERVVTDHALSARLRRAGRDRALTFSWDRHATALANALTRR